MKMANAPFKLISSPNDPEYADFSGALGDASGWLRDVALPFWSRAGFDAERGAFHEQLDFGGQVMSGKPRRAMVQARQISVFSAAALSGRFTTGAHLAMRAAQNMIERYDGADGKPGWIFALGDDGSVDSLRDLYAHAFILFGLSWAVRVDPRQSFYDAIERTLGFLDHSLRDHEGGGYFDSMPRKDMLRRQNPHMHLFEAFLALYEATGEARFLGTCERLHELLMGHLLAPDSGALREYFDDDWRVYPVEGQGRVEPGHLFEWSWLLRQYELLAGTDQSDPIGRMMGMAVRHGFDLARGRIIDEIGEDGRPLATSSRSWPHAEALKALSSIAPSLGGGSIPAMTAILRRITTIYCPAQLEGLWRDQMNADDQATRPDVPASTLYHLYFGITAVEDMLSD